MKIERKATDASNVNVVTLSTSTYNKLKNENMRGRMFVEYILDQSNVVDEDAGVLFIDSDAVSTAIQFCYPELYRRRLNALLQSEAEGEELIEEEELPEVAVEDEEDPIMEDEE